jgi:hypothetical protein
MSRLWSAWGLLGGGAATCLLLLLVSGHARAAPTLALDLARPVPDPQGSLLMLDRDGAPLELLSPRFSLSVLGGHSPLRYDGNRDVSIRVDDTLGVVVGAALGLGLADLGVAVPVHLLIAGSWDDQTLRAIALGDLLVMARVSLLPPGTGPFHALFSTRLTIPTGRSEVFAGRNGFTAEPGLGLSLHPGRFHLSVRPGVLIQGGTNQAEPYLSDWLTLRMGLGVGLGPDQVVRPELGLDGMLPVSRADSAAAEILGGVAVQPPGGFTISGHGGFGIGNMPGIAAARVVVCIAWTGQGLK